MRFSYLVVLLPIFLLVGCSGVDVPFAKSTTGRLPKVAEVPEEEETVRGAEDPPIVTLEVSSKFQERSLTKTEKLPSSIIVPNTNLRGVPLTSALQAVLDGTDISLSWDSNDYEDRLVTVMNLSGALSSVVKKICLSAKVFCEYRNGLLELKEEETFIIDLPAVPTKDGVTSSTANSMADTIKTLSSGAVNIDAQGGNLIYTTNVDGYGYVHEYLDQLRHGRPLVVMQLYIWEVTLTHDNATGINWSKFDIGSLGGKEQALATAASTAFQAIKNPGVSLGATFTGKVNAKAVLNFLNKQGQVQTISNPQLTFVSGSKAEFRVGGKQRYISEVGNSNNVSGGTNNSNAVTTDSITTGLTVNASGTYENGILSSVLEITTQDVLSMNTTPTANGGTIDLPETSERKVTTSIRVRPGDNLVLAGLVTSRDTNNREGFDIPFFKKTIPGYKNDELKNTELVILVKPSIVKFSVRKKQTEQQMPLNHFNKTDKYIGDEKAYIIDKDGSHTLTIPRDTVSIIPKENMKNIGISSSKIDKKLMQRGFSYAFDEMRDPSTSINGNAR